MALCKVTLLVGALLLVTTFAMRIKVKSAPPHNNKKKKQVKELSPQAPSEKEPKWLADAAATLAAEKKAAASQKEIELSLEHIRQRYMQPEIVPDKKRKQGKGQE